MLSYTGQPWEPSFSFQRRYRLLFASLFVCFSPSLFTLNIFRAEHTVNACLRMYDLTSHQDISVHLILVWFFLKWDIHSLSNVRTHDILAVPPIFRAYTLLKTTGLLFFPAFKTILLHALTSLENNSYEKSVQSVFSNFAFCLKAASRS